MAKAVLISIRTAWVDKILSGEKTLEARKTRPKLETPFKVYIYCTNPKNTKLWKSRTYIYADDHSHNIFDRCWSGDVVGEFVCDRIDTINPEMEPYGIYDVDDDFVAQTRLVNGALWDYGKGATLYGWHISKLEIYDTPKPLSEFKGLCKVEADCGCCPYYNYTKMDCDGRTIKRPPQSWCYVEELR